MTVSNLMVKIGADISELQSAMGKVQKSVQDTGKRMTDLGKTISTRVTAPLTALGAVAVRAFGVQEKAELQLRAALQANGREVDKLFDRYNSFAKQMQEVTVVGDETTLAMLQQAESMGITGDAAERAVRNAIALSATQDVSAKSAIRYTAALEQGNATMLARYLPTLRDVEEGTERTAMAQDILGKAFSVAEAEAQTTVGAFSQMRNAVGDLLEEIGSVIAEAILPLVRRIKELAEQAQTVNPAMIKMGVVIAGVVASIGPLLIVLGSLAKAIAVVLSPLALKLAAITALSLGIVYLAKNLDVLMNRFRVVFATMANVVLKQVDSMLETLGRFFGIFDTKMLVSITSARALLMGLTQDIPEIEGEFQNMGEFIQSVIADLGSAFEWLSNRIFTGSGKVIEATDQFKRSFSGAMLTSGVAVRGLVKVSADAGKKIPRDVDDITESAINMGDALQNQVASAIQNFATTIGNAFTGDAGAEGFFNNILLVVADFGNQLGRALVAAGVAALAFKSLLANPAGAIAAGSALIAASTIAKNLLEKGPSMSVNDALITSDGKVIKFHPNDNILAMKDFSGLGGGGSQKVEVFGTIKGQDLFISSQRGSTSWNR